MNKLTTTLIAALSILLTCSTALSQTISLQLINGTPFIIQSQSNIGANPTLPSNGNQTVQLSPRLIESINNTMKFTFSTEMGKSMNCTVTAPAAFSTEAPYAITIYRWFIVFSDRDIDHYIQCND